MIPRYSFIIVLGALVLGGCMTTEPPPIITQEQAQAESGDTEAQYRLALRYINGNIRSPNPWRTVAESTKIVWLPSNGTAMQPNKGMRRHSSLLA